LGGDEAALRDRGSELDELIAKGEARDMILVFPDASSKLGATYLSSPTIGDYETYIARELVAHIDANYRTLPDRDSRGIAGCGYGAAGALHLALTYPEVFSAAAPRSGIYDLGADTVWERRRFWFQTEPEDFDDAQTDPRIALAAAAASNPDKPPFYLDVPFRVVEGEAQDVPEVQERIFAQGVVPDLQDYLEQPVRLRGLLIYHTELDVVFPVESARSFSEMLTELGVEHDYVELAGASERAKCSLDREFGLKFMSEHLGS
jgi:pimeloyl-ACP methyl ester carboxylesterase